MVSACGSLSAIPSCSRTCMHSSIRQSCRGLLHRPGQGACQRGGGTCEPVPSRHVRCHAARKPNKDEDDEPPSTPINALAATIKRKSVEVGAKLKELGEEVLEERMKSSVQIPANPPYRLSTLIAESVPRGKTVLVYEVARPTPTSTSVDLPRMAREYVAAGADALAVKVDSYDTPEGLKDLWTVTQAVKVPVIARDWLIHPLQVIEAKEAGAAGALGVISQVNGRGTAVLSSFAAAIGLDAPVEVVNMREVDGLAKAGVAFYGINIGVGISVAVPGFASDLAHGLLGTLPFGAISLVGVRSVEEARKAKMSGADALLIKRELIAQYEAKPESGGVRHLSDLLDYATSLDD